MWDKIKSLAGAPKRLWDGFRSGPYWYQAVAWGIVGASVVSLVRECG